MSLRPCPHCGRMMDPARPVCAYCQQAGIPAPSRPVPTILGPPSGPAPAAAPTIGSLISQLGMFLTCGCTVPILLLGLALFGLGSIHQPPTLPAPAAAPLRVVEHTWRTTAGGNLRITGTVVNESDRSYRYASVSINLYDASGAQVGSTLANVNNLGPRSRWKFEALATEENVDRYVIQEITAF